MLKLFVMLVFVFGAGMAQATPNCDHPNFYVKGCDYPELNGHDGADGKDGRDGIDGRDGKDGVVPTEWYDTMLRYSNYSLAASVIDFTTPVFEKNRAAITVTSFGGRKAMGMSYGRRFGDKENTILSLGFGTAGHEKILKAQVGWEF